MKALFTLVLSAIPLTAWSCHCLEPYIADAYQHSTAIAMVRVERVQPIQDGAVRAEAEVLTAWKADLPRYLEFLGAGGCDYPLVEGEWYLIFLERGRDGDLRTARCRGNRRRSEASVTLNWLDRHGRRASVPQGDATSVSTR